MSLRRKRISRIAQTVGNKTKTVFRKPISKVDIFSHEDVIGDIYFNKYKMPNQVYILAPGPNGISHYRRIPSHAFIIAVNSAILIPMTNAVGFNIKIWMIADKDAINKNWWNVGNNSFNGDRIFSREFSSRMNKQDRKPKLTFLIDQKPAGDFMRTAGTVAGCAATFCHINLVSEIIFCGVDMSGNEYYDGSRNPDERWMKEHGATWTARAVLDERIRYLKATGMKVKSLSPTKLKEVEMI